MYSIGEFSRITEITVKALRHYHSIGLLEPGHVDPDTGYRYYTQANVEKARAIRTLRGLTFSLEEIQGLLKDCRDDADTVDYLQLKRAALEDQSRVIRDISGEIDRLIRAEKEARAMSKESKFVVEEKKVEPLRVVSKRWKGTYPESGKVFSQLGRKAGRRICGPALNLYYDEDFKEADADVESCFPVGEWKGAKDAEVRVLPGGRCVSLIHQGPYDQLGRSYAVIMEYLKKNRLKSTVPSRNIFLKGPGMIFKGNPKKYLTEIQFFLAE